MLRLRCATLSLWRNTSIRSLFGWKVSQSTPSLSRNSFTFVTPFTNFARLVSSSSLRSTELSQQEIKKYTSFVDIGGGRFEIRPMLPSDAQNEKKFVNSLSFETVYNRRCGPHKYTDSEIDRLTHIDYTTDFALVVTRPKDGEFVAGFTVFYKLNNKVARYHTGQLPAEECDFAVVVADEYQGKGIAKVLVERLMEIAKEYHGKKIFRSEVLHSNYHTIHLNEILGRKHKMEINKQFDFEAQVLGYFNEISNQS